MNDRVRNFVEQGVFGVALSLDAPKTVNIRTRYEDYLVSDGHTRLAASERAEEVLGEVRDQVSKVIEGWDALGLPSPLRFGPRDEVLVSWSHERHLTLTGFEPLDPEFLKVWDWLGGLKSDEFIIPTAAYLAVTGCDPIIVTEGPYDGGVDVIGRIPTGPLRSVVVFVQAKTIGGDFVKTKTLYEEYGKYIALHRSDLLGKYLNALDAARQNDGASDVYLLLSNAEYNFEVRRVAKALGVVLRSRRQLAFWGPFAICVGRG